MNKSLYIATFILAVSSSALFFGATLPAAHAAEPINAIAVIVNDKPVTLLEVKREAQRLRNLDGKLTEDEARQTALDDLIDRQLQLQRAALLGIIINDEMLQKRIEELVDELGLQSQAALEKVAKDRFLMSYDQFRERVREDMQIQALFYREVFSRAQTYEDEVDQFLKQDAGISNAREYHLRHILIEVADDGSDIDEKRDLALSIRTQAENGADFSELARVHSDDESSAGAGGNLGFRAEDALPEAFIADVQNMEAGEISEIISSSRGFHLLKLEQARGGELRESIKSVRLHHIFFSANAETRAQDIWSTIKGKEDFSIAVQKYSLDDVSINKDGEIGWFDEQDIPPYFSSVIAQMKEGDISKPVKSPFGWHILYLAEERSEKYDVQRLRDQARRLLRERRALAQRDVWLRRLRSDAFVQIVDPSFDNTLR